MVPLRRLMSSGSMWLDCIAQVGTNIGWIFLVTWLPRYLISQHQVPVLERGVMAMTPLLVGIVGMYAGGWLTDILAARLGVRWGRRLPLSITRFSAAAGYGLCLWFSTLGTDSPLNTPWMYVAAFSLVAFSTDLGVPAAWAFKQDVGGRYVGSILGWGNMWGNLGATVSPPIYNYFLGEQPGLAEWNAMFTVCMCAFIMSGICGLGIDAATPIAPPDEDDR
jgi:nitrate/nitrite transporter NarK